MNYKAGDQVVHSAYGVGVVLAVEEMEFTGRRKGMFYRLGFDDTKIVWVPVQDLQEERLRPLTRKGDLARYRAVLKAPPNPLEGDFQNRRMLLENRLKKHSFLVLCEIVRDLSGLRDKKALNNYDLQIYKNARHSLVQEWAAASGLSPVEVDHQIEGMLEQGAQVIPQAQV